MKTLAFAALLSLGGMVMADTDRTDPEPVTCLTVGDLIDELQHGVVVDQWDEETPVLVAIGRGRILAPTGLVLKMVQPVAAAGYYVLHNDPESTPAVVLYEHPKLEPPYPITEQEK